MRHLSIKDYDEKNSGKVATYLRANRSVEESNVKRFCEEVADLGSINPLVVAFGADAYSIVARNFQNQYRVLKIPHYANYSSKEKYREQVSAVWLV